MLTDEDVAVLVCAEINRNGVIYSPFSVNKQSPAQKLHGALKFLIISSG